MYLGDNLIARGITELVREFEGPRMQFPNSPGGSGPIPSNSV